MTTWRKIVPKFTYPVNLRVTRTIKPIRLLGARTNDLECDADHQLEPEGQHGAELNGE